MREARRIENPFPGLRPFDTHEYLLFFGREGQSDELLARLGRTRFLAVVGTSGSGKSSLVRAGLLPSLHGGLMRDAGSGWRVALMRPGGDPLGNLAAALAARGVLPEAGGGLAGAEGEAVIEATLRGGSLGLVEAARQARLAEHENLLVVVDQFEELFRFRALSAGAGTADDAAAFVKLLLEAAGQRELRVYVVLTMRSDFLGDCAQFQGLPEAINDGQYLIPRMTRDERRAAVTGPARVARGRVSEQLVNRLLNDVGDNPDQLPILQHALMRTWDYWKTHGRDGEPVSVEHYEAVGAMAEALSRHADEAWDELRDDRQRLIAARMFKALTEKGADNREIRRPTSLREICDINGAAEGEVVAVVEVFRRAGRSFLMPPAEVALDAECVVDISHESLIRNWERLRRWTDEEAQAARDYRRLAETAVLHREGREGMLTAVAVQNALEWQQRTAPTRAWGLRYHPEFDLAMRYLAESEAHHEAELERERRQREAELERERREREQAERYAEEQRRFARRNRRLLYVSVALALVALAGAGVTAVALVNSRAAQRRAEIAQQDAETLARERNVSIKNETIARIEAEDEKKNAEEQKRLAEEEGRKAEEQKRVAEERATEAEEERRKAEAAEDDAFEAQKEAEREGQRAADKARRLEEEKQQGEIRKVANDNFRDGVAAAQRGEYEAGIAQIEEAIKGYNHPLVKNEEAIADSLSQLGNLLFDELHATFLASNGVPAFGNAYGSREQIVRAYDEAARIYSAPPVEAAEKAAAAHYTLAGMLMQFTKGRPEDGGGRAAASGAGAPRLRPDPADEATLFFAADAVRIADYESKPLDPEEVERNKADAVERFGKAYGRFEQAYGKYRQAFDRDPKDDRAEGMMKSARAGMKKSAYRLGVFHMAEALAAAEKAGPPDPGADPRAAAAPPADAPRANADESWRAAARHFEQLLALTKEEKADDRSVGTLLIWLGGIYEELGERAAAARYHERARAALRETLDPGHPDGRAEFSAGDMAMEAGLRRAAAVHFEESLAAAGRAGDIESRRLRAQSLIWKGRTLTRLGQLNEQAGDDPSEARAESFYRQALAVFKEIYRTESQAAGSIGPADLQPIIAYARASGDYVFALEDVDFAVELAAKYGARRAEQARALYEKASLHMLVGEPETARAAYERAAALYRELLGEPATPASAEALRDELERIERILQAFKTSAPGHQPAAPARKP